MADIISQVTEEGLFTRMKNAIGGVVFGLLLGVIAVGLLWFNEKRAVTTARSLEEGLGAVVSADAGKVDPGLEGKLVHVIGQADARGPVQETDLGIARPGLVLEREVEMYQWVEEEERETRKKVGGGTRTETTYEYRMEWDDDENRSSNFEHPQGHENPPMTYKSRTFVNSDATLGARRLSAALLGQLSGGSPVALGEEDLARLPGNLRQNARISGTELLIGRDGPADPASPRLGDLRIRYRLIAPTRVSVVARQDRDGLTGYQTKAGDVLEILYMGEKSAEEIFAAEQQANAILTWGLRAFGWFLMFLGIMMFFRPLQVMADILPFFGSILGAGLALFAFVLSGFLSLMVVAIAWFAVRPILSACLLAGGIGLLVLGKSMGKKAE